MPVAGPIRPSATVAPGNGSLSAIEIAIIDHFVHLARLLAIPKSVAEIFGLLYISPRPLSMDDLIGRLNLSKGSASQGLRLLRGLGAIKVVYMPASRKDFYEAETELRQLAAGFLRERLGPELASSLVRLERIHEMVKKLPAEQRQHASSRIDKLRQWEKRGRQFLPLVTRVLS